MCPAEPPGGRGRSASGLLFVCVQTRVIKGGMRSILAPPEARLLATHLASDSVSPERTGSGSGTDTRDYRKVYIHRRTTLHGGRTVHTVHGPRPSPRRYELPVTAPKQKAWIAPVLQKRQRQRAGHHMSTGATDDRKVVLDDRRAWKRWKGTLVPSCSSPTRALHRWPRRACLAELDRACLASGSIEPSVYF